MHHTSVIILGHGSKSEEAIDDFNFVVEATKKKHVHDDVYGANIELASPSFEEVVTKLYKEGKTNIVVIPYFLFNGYHIKKDLPDRISALYKQCPGLHIDYTPAIGKETLMADILLKRIEEINH